MKAPRTYCLALIVGLATPALANDDAMDEPVEPSIPGSGGASALPLQSGRLPPPPVDYPGLLTPDRGVVLYIDHSYETVDDLSTFWWVQGRGSNYRLSVGGIYRADAWRLGAEVPVQYTYLHIDALMGQTPTEPDRSKAAISLGDVLTSAAYIQDTTLGDVPISVGVGLLVRWPTHTTRYRFELMDGSILEIGFPYYLHVAPTALASISFGALSLTVNQGVLAMLAKDVTIGDVLQRIPNIYFWESHVAADLVVAPWLDGSVEVVSMVQLNRVDVDNMNRLNNTRAVFVTPGVSISLQGIWIVLAARFGVSGRSSRDFGVITFSGERAYLVRLCHVF